LGIQWRGPVPPGNRTVGREGNVVDLIVDHWTVVMFEGAIRRFKDPTSRLSAHYVIGQDGRIAQLVSEDDAAYHAGKYAVNLRSIGIEHEASPTMAPTAALYAASARLHREIAGRHGLALRVGGTVLPHHAIAPTECPGTLDLDRIVREATEEDDMFTEEDRRKLDRVYAHLEAYEPLVWTTRLQRWLAKAIRSVFPNADVSGPDVETGQPFKG
jgi:N-acetyl-anhydromuramyl-L-alanine amidase AmpD